MTRRTPLRVIEAAESLAEDIYVAVRQLPSEERYGLTSQMRRAVVSIGSNLAEGSVRPTDADFARFIGIADGSAAELFFQLRICHRLGYLDHITYEETAAAVNSLRKQMRSLNARLTEPTM